MRPAGCVALRVRFFARTWPSDFDFARSGGPRDAPEVDFRGRNGCFFDVFSFDKRMTRKTSDLLKTSVFLSFFILRSIRALTENVPKPIRSASDCVWRRERRLRESWDVSRRLAERLGAGLGMLLDASWPLLGHPGRHLVGFGAPLGRP